LSLRQPDAFIDRNACSLFLFFKFQYAQLAVSTASAMKHIGTFVDKYWHRDLDQDIVWMHKVHGVVQPANCLQTVTICEKAQTHPHFVDLDKQTTAR